MTVRNVALEAGQPARLEILGASLAAIVFGMFLVFATGIAQPEAVHNAAHDSRHSFSMPCH